MKQMRSRFRLITLLLVCGFLLTLVVCAGSVLRTAGISLPSLSSLPFAGVSASPDPASSPVSADSPDPASSPDSPSSPAPPADSSFSPPPSDALPGNTAPGGNDLPGAGNSPEPEYNVYGL